MENHPWLLFEKTVEIPAPRITSSNLAALAASIRGAMGPSAEPIRLAVTCSNADRWELDVGAISGIDSTVARVPGILDFVTQAKSGSGFNVAFVVPTGVGSELGGHAGDAGPAARLLASLSDTLITHPNVVNASDINELPANGLYVEGSILSRFLLGTIGLQRVRSNRVLVVIHEHENPIFTHSAINSVNAARATFGLDCPGIVTMRPGVRLRARFATSGRAAGRVEGIEQLLQVLKDRRAEYDAVAISSIIDVPHEFHREYFDLGGDMVNPWGGVEAMLTHALSSLLDVPTAHAPMFESEDIANMDVGVVDPRMAAEAVSQTFLQCTLKGLATAPRLVTDPAGMARLGVLTAGDVSCLVIPDGCLGLPTLAALLQNIPVIVVEEAKTIMKNDLAALPWRAGQFARAGTMLEAVGMVAALRAGLARESLCRPLVPVQVERLMHAEVPEWPSTSRLRIESPESST